VTVNGVAVPFEDLVLRLKRMFAARDDHVLFFDADDEAPYGLAMEVLDRAREGGAVTIAPLTEALAPAAGSGAPSEPAPAAPDVQPAT
ncbi:biopolymer transporter ExbD, partial [bacterium]|nr:biopolymer transporter ExbD [bacterium]